MLVMVVMNQFTPKVAKTLIKSTICQATRPCVFNKSVVFYERRGTDVSSTLYGRRHLTCLSFSITFGRFLLFITKRNQFLHGKL